MKLPHFVLLFIVFSFIACQNPKKGTDIMEVATSKELSFYLLFHQSYMADHYLIGIEQPLIKKELRTLNFIHPFTKSCDLDLTEASSEIKELLDKKCKFETIHEELVEKYPFLEDENQWKEVIKLAIKHNDHYLSSDYSDLKYYSLN